MVAKVDTDSLCNSKCHNRPKLIFWFDAPPRAGAGAFKAVADNWGNEVFYFCLNNLSEERINGGWRQANHGNAQIIILSEIDNSDKFLSDFINNNPHAIHVFNGFRSMSSKYIDFYLKLVNIPKIAIYTERPGVYGSATKKIMKKIYIPFIHKLYYFKYRKKIKALIPLGEKGINTFSRYGWSNKDMYPFMYDPPEPKHFTRSGITSVSKPIKFVYVGRFARTTKGIDILITAFNNIQSDNWQLDLVGGYGEFKEQTIDWANGNDKVNFLGTWKSTMVTENLSSYDVVIVPSRFDGWNVVVNEAIRAGIGVIVSDEAVSDELIKCSEAGIVFKMQDKSSIINAINSVLDNPEVVIQWKKRAHSYAPLISSVCLGEYFINVLDYAFNDNLRTKPQPPWLDNKVR